MKNPSNLLRIIKDVHLESQIPKHLVSPYLQRPRLLAGCLDFHKPDPAFRHKDQTIRHAVKAGTGELWCDATSAFYCFDQFLFYVFLSHMIYHPKLKWGDVEVVSLISGTFLIGCFLGL